VTTTIRYWLSIGDGKSYGPYSLADLRRFQTEGRIGFNAQVCPEGGSEWAPVAKFLDFGAPPTSPPPPPPPAMVGMHSDPRAKSKVAAGILGILLGCLGIHNFYLGYTGKGVAQLLITILTCGYCALISAIWGIVEGILILTGSIATDASGVPLRD
jgi:TM2 domain-containing membrane protein YozV